jgi:cold-inducible RNA-binding protein
MEAKIYVGNLSQDTTEQDLRTLLSDAGSVGTVDVIMDRQTGKSKGFAFVVMGSADEAQKAISMLDGKDVNDHTLKANIARPREERPTSNR